MRLEAGDEVDQYRIVRELGQGGMGAVYEVEHVKLGVRYALKTFVSLGERQLTGNLIMGTEGYMGRRSGGAKPPPPHPTPARSASPSSVC